MISHSMVRQRLVNEFESNKDTVVQALRRSPGLIHIAFDGWRSRNEHALFGISTGDSLIKGIGFYLCRCRGSTTPEKGG